MVQAHSEEQRLVFEGAVISARGRTRALTAIDSGLVGLVPKDKVVRALAAGVILVADRKVLNAKGVGEASPRPYSRKFNPCKRAKERRWMKKILGRFRCESNHAYFSSVVPNDPLYSSQYASSLMSLPAAWDRTIGSSNLVVLVIDTGVSTSHSDLAANMWVNPGEIAGDGIDNDNNGYIDDIHGINAINGSGAPEDDHGHGTHVAGILGAHGNNSRGVAGVAWNVKIAAAKFLSSTGVGSLADAVKAITYGTALRLAGNKIVASNNSWGGGSYSSTLAAVIRDAGDAGILFVAAAGNAALNNDTTPSYPSSYSSSNVLAVASTDSSAALSSFSNYGVTSVDIAAPGSSIPSTYLVDTYVYMSGTSMAAPQVAGVASLVQSVCGGTLTHQQVKNAILSSGQQYASLNGKVLTSAIVNAYGAVMAAMAYCPSNVTPTATATAIASNTAIAPTASPVPSQEQTPASPTATPAPATPSATSTPPDPSVTATPIVIEPTATPEPSATPVNDSGVGSRLQLVVNPQKNSDRQNALNIIISEASSSSSAALRVLGRSGRWAYACPTMSVPLIAGSAALKVQLPKSVVNLDVLQLWVKAGNTTDREKIDISSSQSQRDYRAVLAAFKRVCQSFSQALKQSSAQREIKARRFNG